MTGRRRLLVTGFLVFVFAAPATAELKFLPQELPVKLGVGYAVNLVDMNADGSTDILIVDSKRVIWLENPKWTEHTVMSTPDKTDNVSIATHDIDGDGRLDAALGADWNPGNTKSGGTIQWLSSGKKTGDLWDVFPIGEEPTVHRMRWVDLDHDGRPELVVAPLSGRNSTRPNFAEAGVRILAYKIPSDPRRGPWTPEVINDELHVTHNFWPTDLDRDGRVDLLVVSFEGVSLLRRSPDGKWSRTLLGDGNQQTRPNRGASEIKHGKLAGNRDYIATIEPWHGHQVVVYTPPEGKPADVASKKWTRHVIDENLQWGHAVWCANLDADDDQELIIGVRDDKSREHPRGLRIYDPVGDDPKNWKPHRIDPGGVAIEDLAAADLDADGKTDIVAVGRQTHNVRVYWNK